MLLSLGAVGFALLTALPACGTGGLSPQPPNLGDPWVERRAVLGSQGVTPELFGYGSPPLTWYSCFVVLDIVPLERGEQPVDLVAADFDEDGRPDLAVLVPLWNHVQVLLNVAD